MKNFQKYDRISYIILSITVFLGIAAFIPGGLIPAGILKGYVIVIGVLVAFVAWLIARLIEGTFRIPWTPMIAALGLFVATLFLSSIFSHTPYLAFFGEGFEQGTFAVLGALSLGLFLAVMLFVTRRRVANFLKAFFILYGVLALFQLAHLFLPGLTSLGVFFSSVDTPVGIWSDFAFLSGAVLIGSVFILQFSKLEKQVRMVLIGTGILALFFVILANIFIVWILVGLSSIIMLVYMLIANRFSEERRFPMLSFSMSLIALLFILANTLFGGVLANVLHASYTEVHPSLSATTHTAVLSLKHNIVLGAGPNRFLKEWLLYRPTIVNANTFWDTPFNSGVSLFGTIAMLGGILGILAGLFFLFSFGSEVVKKLFLPTQGENSGMMVFGLCMITVYFLLAIVIASPGIAITLCAFAFIGILFGSLFRDGRIPSRELHFLKDQRAGFFSILAIVTLLLISVGTVYASTERFASLVFFEKSLVSAQKDDLAAADGRLVQAIALADLPIFERTRVVFAQRSIQQILASSSESSKDAISANLKNAVSIANSAGRQAISLDPADPANYLAFGDMLRMIVPLKIDGVTAAATDAYKQAIALAPSYPKSYLDLATLYFDTGDNANARVYVQKALDQKYNYTDAFFLLAQIEVSDGNTAKAIEKIQNATLLDPNNPDVYFELGLLRYNSGDYDGAASAFKETVALNNQYLNGWYYLALADQKIGNTKEATDILTALHKRLPDNQDVKNALMGTTTTTINPPAATTKPTQEKAKKLPLPAGTSGDKTTP